MKPLICPQCGGKILEYDPSKSFAACGYCETRFVIEAAKRKSDQPSYQPLENTKLTKGVLVAGGTAALAVLAVIFFAAVLTNRNEPKPTAPNLPAYNPTAYPTATPNISPAPTPDLNLLEFGGKGTGDGLFQDADAIAVDGKGRIYVADETLRVQQFDEAGNFLKLWQIPTETSYYKRARRIEKIGVDAKERLFVLIDYGIVLVYENDSSEPQKVIHFAPNPIQDFAFRHDGGRVFLVSGEENEYLVQVTDAGRTVRRVDAFHSNAADASMSPSSVGLAAIRFAVDGAGNIFSVYALGDLGSYQLSYNSEDFMIFRFTPEGKYVNKFVRTMNSVGICVDNQSRIYISDEEKISVYSNLGESLAVISNLPRHIDAFALDKQNFVYVLQNDRVIKRPAI